MRRKPPVEYVLEPAEQTSLSDHSVDLITVARAIHWFSTVYSEVRRVAKPGAVIAVWAYSLLTDIRFDRFDPRQLS